MMGTLRKAFGGIMASAMLDVVLLTCGVSSAVSATAGVRLYCSTKEVVITSGPNGVSSTSKKVDMTFWFNDVTKTAMVDNTALAIKRFDAARITAEHDGMIYDLDRQDHSLSYAGSTTKGIVVITIIGSGTCSPVRSLHPGPVARLEHRPSEAIPQRR